MNKNTPKIENAERLNDTTKNFTAHQSALSEEGRRNQPRHASPKYTKKKHALEHAAEAEKKSKMGVLAPLTPESLTLDKQPKIY